MTTKVQLVSNIVGNVSGGASFTGIVTATNFVGNLTGNASYASVAGVATYASVAGIATYASVAGAGGGATGGGSDDVFYENGQTVTTNYTLTTNKNAVTAGPITIDSGVTVTVPSGASWVVV